MFFSWNRITSDYQRLICPLRFLSFSFGGPFDSTGPSAPKALKALVGSVLPNPLLSSLSDCYQQISS